MFQCLLEHNRADKYGIRIPLFKHYVDLYFVLYNIMNLLVGTTKTGLSISIGIGS